PAYRIHDQYRFNRAEILDWATANKIGISHEIFQEPEDKTTPVLKLTEALKRGGIHYRVNGKNKEAVLRSVVELLRLPEDVNQDLLLKVILAREELGSTGIGDGIAIPHARNPIVLNIPCAIISLSFLEEAVDFGAVDGKPVHCLFTLISPTVRTHLQMLSQMAFGLKDSGVKEAIARQSSRDIILAEIQRVENTLTTPQAATSG
ncbi:MAG: PTS sugar transporter subunit IIA, partial [Candidatus Omnitrophica bacterium]|nr:PTS sugar transporter subunit IIA [Candidatus Omnitrophota bacterium]